MHQIKDFVRKHPHYSYMLYACCVLGLGTLLILAVINTGKLPSTVWLPNSTQYRSDDEVIFGLPVKSETVTTSYGPVIRYTTAVDKSIGFKDPLPWVTIDEFKSDPDLRASACPNLSGIESLLPSDCEKVGTFQGSPVYQIRRQLPSEMAELFVKVGKTFIYIKHGDIGYIKTFKNFPRLGTENYLSVNNKRAEHVINKRLAAQAETKRVNGLAYTHLNFTPALATTVPPGWTLEGNNPKNIHIDGPDARHPKLVSTYYYVKKKNGQKDKSIAWYSGNLADFVVMGTCGPSPGSSMDYLPCTRVPGTDYYVAELYDERNDFVRYTYYPIDRSLVVTGLFIYSPDGKPPARPADMISAQDLITKSAKPVNKNNLKGSTYERIFYDP